jgi:hypothetical protein
MKTTKILLLILFLTIPSLPEVLMLHVNYEKTDSVFCLECDHRKKTECIPIEYVEKRVGRYECTSGKTTRKK